MSLNHCVYCGARAYNGFCSAHSDLPDLDHQFASLRKRLLAEKSMSEQGKRMDCDPVGQIECS
jgi:hypothetical protein